MAALRDGALVHPLGLLSASSVDGHDDETAFVTPLQTPSAIPLAFGVDEHGVDGIGGMGGGAKDDEGGSEATLTPTGARNEERQSAEHDNEKEVGATGEKSLESNDSHAQDTPTASETPVDSSSSTVGQNNPAEDFDASTGNPIHDAVTGEKGTDATLVAAGEKDATVGKDNQDESEEAEDESKYPGGAALTILTIGLCLATFVVALDNTIIGQLSPNP